MWIQRYQRSRTAAFGEAFIQAHVFILIAGRVPWTAQGRNPFIVLLFCPPPTYQNTTAPSSDSLPVPTFRKNHAQVRLRFCAPSGRIMTLSWSWAYFALRLPFLHKEAFFKNSASGLTLRVCVCHRRKREPIIKLQEPAIESYNPRIGGGGLSASVLLNAEPWSLS